MDQVEMIYEEEQSPLHIKRELDINIPYRVSFPSCNIQQQKDTPKTAIRNIEHLEPEEQEIPTETTPKTQIDVSSPRVPFLTHSQIMGMNQDDDDMLYSKSVFNNPLSEIPEEQTPSQLQNHSKPSSQDFNLDNMSMVNSQQLKFSKKSLEKDLIVRLELENSRQKEEYKEQIAVMDVKIKELEKENFILKKKCNQEKVKQIELQLETEYKITTLNEQLYDQEDFYKKQIVSLKNDLNNAKFQITMLKSQSQQQEQQLQHQSQLSKSQITFQQPYIYQQQQIKQPYHVSLSQSFTEMNVKNQKEVYLSQTQYDSVQFKIGQILRLIDQQVDLNKKDLFDLIQLLQTKIKQILNMDEEEKMDEHRTLITSLKAELGEIKLLRTQLSKIYQDYEQQMNKKTVDQSIDSKINELNLQILGIKQEKLELNELTTKLQNQLASKDQIINELQSKLNNLSQTDTLRKQSQFVRSLQTNSMIDLKIIKESLKQRQEGIKKTFKSQNSPQSRSHNPSPTLKFLNSPKNSNNGSNAMKKQSQQDTRQQFYNKTSEFSVDNSSSHQATNHNNNSSHQNSEIIQKLVEQFKGNSALAQRISSYSKKN
ncbi:unnamed protein product [Paramecium pentaurelia]|uniref:Uncharacterized protein n=1 Tax=Paramecium pentaurelia TaxID=43138 RepID=A0A8S1VEU6_9CILI|nr:unnamed protein product [Paramecium pentaurelia]